MQGKQWCCTLSNTVFLCCGIKNYITQGLYSGLVFEAKYTYSEITLDAIASWHCICVSTLLAILYGE